MNGDDKANLQKQGAVPCRRNLGGGEQNYRHISHAEADKVVRRLRRHWRRPRAPCSSCAKGCGVGKRGTSTSSASARAAKLGRARAFSLARVSSDMADPKSEAMIPSRASPSGCGARGASNPKKSSTRKQMIEGSRNKTYGSHAFGFKGDLGVRSSYPFDAFLATRDPRYCRGSRSIRRRMTWSPPPIRRSTCPTRRLLLWSEPGESRARRIRRGTGGGN